MWSQTHIMNGKTEAKQVAAENAGAALETRVIRGD